MILTPPHRSPGTTAALLTELEGIARELDGLRIVCPTCGGHGTVFDRILYDFEITPHHVPCPDCTDRRMTHARAWRIVAAVFDPAPLPDHFDGTTRDYLRGIR